MTNNKEKEKLNDWDNIIYNACEDYSEETQAEDGDFFNTWFQGKYINPIRNKALDEFSESIKEKIKNYGVNAGIIDKGNCFEPRSQSTS